MDNDVIARFVTQLHQLVTVPAHRASLGFLSSAAGGNPKFAPLKAAADLYQISTEEVQKSLDDFIYTAIHYACFSFLHFLEDYEGQDEENDGKKIELIFRDADNHSADLFALSQYQLRTLFRRYAATQEWKSFLSKAALEKKDGDGLLP